jgi:hypothetical protein
MTSFARVALPKPDSDNNAFLESIAEIAELETSVAESELP